MSYDPIDSLIYLSRDVRSHLDGLADELSDRFGFSDENEGVEYLDGWIGHIKEIILKEAKAHFDGRTEYSTGHPFARCYKYPTTEPGEGGEEVPVIAEAWVNIHPDGSPEQPYDAGGLWSSKTHP